METDRLIGKVGTLSEKAVFIVDSEEFKYILRTVGWIYKEIYILKES
jgi:hypothetical protein